MATALVAAGTVGLLIGVAGVAQAATAIGLGTAGSFVVLAGAGVTNTGPTTLNGDIGTFPNASISGSGNLTVTGTVHAGDAVTQDAKTDLVTAYDVAAGQASNVTVSGDLGGQTLTTGVYTSASSMGLTGSLTLDAQGNPDAVFVFQVGSALTTASASQVLLIGGAQACNVYWQVGSSATLGTGSAFRGTVLALTSITVTTGTTIEGRVLARNGAVTLDTNVITAPVCTSTPPATVPTTTAQDAAAAAAAAAEAAAA
ncbi:MAG TPA: ice-binding family protein, partial [Cellulomonas sp.]